MPMPEQAQARCPCCGQGVPATEILFEAGPRLVSYGGRTVRLTPTQMNALRCLAQHHPGFADDNAMLRAICAHHSRAEDPVGLLRVVVSKLRSAIRPLGLQIANRWGGGYCLMLPEGAQLSPLARQRRPVEAATFTA